MYKAVEFNSLYSMNKWLDENRDITIVKLSVNEASAGFHYVIIYQVNI